MPLNGNKASSFFKSSLSRFMRYRKVTNEKSKLAEEFSVVPKPDFVSKPGGQSTGTNTASRSQTISYYLRLSKFRLSGLVVSTSVAASLLPNVPFDPFVIGACAVGTGLAAASANSLNQILEMNYDSQMSRTKARPLVLKQLKPPEAVCFSVVTGATGVYLLHSLVNPVTAALGAANIILYSFLYTPLKRRSYACTWVGAVVGAIPPVMGWTAATGGSIDLGCLVLAGILYTWQFPHFNALSWNYKADYKKAGYKMLSVDRPQLCKSVALRHCVIMSGLCLIGVPLTNLTTWTFAAVTLPVNAYFTYLALQFYQEGSSRSARSLFRFSLLQLPIIMVCLFLFHKRKSAVAVEDSDDLGSVSQRQWLTADSGSSPSLVVPVVATAVKLQSSS